MLEIRGLKKVYKAKKGGAQVRALDGVSIRFPEKGMVFLLGKSGSGKSTLLNLCGGLDAPDEGEIVIKGRSSKDFTQSDFDSYRNTFVGFVFQEYNILNEFSVEDNIALALELQGKGRDRAQVKAILAQVDLLDFAKRKPNTLSGGQKQRVAIARALVKNPEILLADEPTGALDSNTGKQVFDTLKKLSADKLVIVVSHDREFAEIYGDRIIELKDGKVVSDVTKEKIAATRAGDNLTFIGEDTIAVQDGSRLTDADMGRIRDFLTRSKGKVLLSCGQKEIDGFRKAARIDEDGGREAFEATDEASIPQKAYTEADSKFIRSKLPFRHALRIGASNLRVKPFRLIFTILLSFIAFTMFGLFSTLTFYDEKSVMLDSYLLADYDTLTLEKHYRYDSVEYVRATGEENYRYTSNEGTARFTPAEMQEFRDKYGAAFGLYNYSTYASYEHSIENLSQTSLSSLSYYNANIYYFAESASADTGLEFAAGESDLSAYGKDDVAISSYLFDSIRRFGLAEVGRDEWGNPISGKEIPLEDYADIIGKDLFFHGFDREVYLTVRGVFRADPGEKYEALQSATGYNAELSQLAYELQTLVASSLCGAVLVSDEFYDAHIEDFAPDPRGESARPDYIAELEDVAYTYAQDESTVSGQFHNLAPYTAQSAADAAFVYFLEEGQTSLGDGEVLLPIDGAFRDTFRSFLNDVRNEGYEQIRREAYERAYQAYFDAYWENFLAEYRQNNAAWREELLQSFIGEGYGEAEAGQMADAQIEQAANDEFLWQAENAAATEADSAAEEWLAELERAQTVLLEYYRYPDSEIRAALDLLSPYLDEAFRDGFSAAFTLTDRLSNEIQTYTVAGFYAAEYGEAIFSESEAQRLFDAYGPLSVYREETNYVPSPDEKYNAVILPMPGRADLSAIVYGADEPAEDDSFYTLVSPLSSSLRSMNYMVEMLGTVFLWVGVAMAVFAMLLLFNFISVSITYKKREIGILRAVGARSADVFKIFYSESAIITLLCYALAMIASFFGCGILNAELADFTNVALFVFGPVSWLVMLGIALATSVAATFLPVYGIAKRRPVESIRAL